MQFNHSRWVIESDIRKCFHNIDHNILLKIIQKKITCKKTLNLIHSALKVGFLDNIGGEAVSNEVGTPQGSVLSPVLCNIYLHEMDLYLYQTISEFNKGSNRKVNSQYKYLNRKLST